MNQQPEDRQQGAQPDLGKAPVADTGNASNPSPHASPMGGIGRSLLDEKADKYIRESGNIEDLPDAQDEQEAAGS